MKKYNVFWNDIYGTTHQLPLVYAFSHSSAYIIAKCEYPDITKRKDFVKFTIVPID